MPDWLRAEGDGVVISLVVQPRSSKTGIVGEQNGELKVRLTSPPVDGAANRLCCEFVAGLLRRPKGAVTLVSGETSRHKRLRVVGVTPEDVVAAFAVVPAKG